jgi:hypothetical protein
VQWFLGSTLLGSELTAPYDSCNLDTKKFAPGAHQLRAVATDNKGAIGEAQITVNIAGTTTTPPTTGNAAPTVAITAPAAGATLSGLVNSTTCVADAKDDKAVSKVDFFVGTQLVTTKTAAPFQCAIDTTKFANGTHTLRAVATDNEGATASTQKSVTIQNAVSTPDPTLPSEGTKAVPTFESVGLYWKPGSNPGAAGCAVQYRKAGESTWKDGLAMWYDPRNTECRGSLVHLSSGTNYEARFALPGQPPAKSVSFKTWSDNFPIAKTVQVASGSQTLNITEGGTASGYVLYTGPATLDANNAVDYNVQISAPYVIVRGLTLRGARRDGIRLMPGAKDVVIEDNDISGWGRDSGKVTWDGHKIGMDMDAAVGGSCYNVEPWLERTIIQRNKLHHPRYGANSWSDGHPSGPQAIAFIECGGNHVFRHNEVYSEAGRYFNDALGGSHNFSTKGFPNSDSDIYGNVIKHVWDDAIEAEGANRNVRIWGNYFDHTATGVASTSTSQGPVYIFRNVWNRSRNMSKLPLDSDNRLYMFKSGSNGTYGDGRRYVFHNTMLQAPPPPGSTLTQGGGMGLMGPGGGQNLTNTVSRNNIFHVWKAHWSSISDNGGGGTQNDLDFDLVNGQVNAYAGAEANRIVGTPKYAAGHGWSAEGTGQYQLAPDSPGYDRGVRIANFNDGFTGAAPDFGAHEAGTPAMKLGRQQ